MVFVDTSQIKDLIFRKCEEIEELTGLDRDDTLRIYHHFKWRKDHFENDWFGNEDKIRRNAGVDPIKKDDDMSKKPKLTCPMCFDTSSADKFQFLACNHVLCKDCFLDYVNFNVKRSEYS